MTEKLQIWEDNNGFYILTDKAEIKDGAWFQDNDDDVIVAVVDKDLKDARLKVDKIVHCVNMHTELVEALRDMKRLCDGCYDDGYVALSTSERIEIEKRVEAVLLKATKEG